MTVSDNSRAECKIASKLRLFSHNVVSARIIPSTQTQKVFREFSKQFLIHCDNREVLKGNETNAVVELTD